MDTDATDPSASSATREFVAKVASLWPWLRQNAIPSKRMQAWISCSEVADHGLSLVSSDPADRSFL